ncbi:glycosyltransferase family 4 protein [Psychroserpens ponticola]|uniref:Glycosyltransferase family 4 protein n=1 Tax=Psychroserpens ponticola TaxID=2932268 RepID=A0ABY7RZJ6_9FLAO|nr:glycosyltransferase family 4 protein [Psychroserpens ponticola]WCO01651.1 glycosyltransferase family 4 protein [Psychroserpens ponticola]
MEFAGKHILIVIENLPAPFDRRVWQEATTLKENGAKVSIICPKMKGYEKSYELIDDIEIYRHPLREGKGALGYLIEYSQAIFWEFVLSWKIFFKKRFHVIHGCNPPDLIFITSLFFKPFGVKYIFDHHDINPELYISKFEKKGFFYKLMVLFEKLTFKTAKYSIATNESYKKIAVERGNMKPENVQVVRSGPKLDRLRILEPKNELKKGKKYLIGYIGVIGEQEGLDLLLESANYILSKRDDVHFGIVGGGTHLEEIKKMAIDMNLSEAFDFYGRVDDQTMLDVLNTADICVNPDKPTAMNDLSTMNKIMEYMALKKPIVQYTLKEGKFSAQKSSLYANNTDPIDFAEKVMLLLDNESQRNEMGEYGYNRVINELSWDFESEKLVSIYNKVFNN